MLPLEKYQVNGLRASFPSKIFIQNAKRVASLENICIPHGTSFFFEIYLVNIQYITSGDKTRELQISPLIVPLILQCIATLC